MDDYLAKIRTFFEDTVSTPNLLALSEHLQAECLERLQSSNISMLPSYHHTLPTGHETGTFLALDMGGSNFRLALVQLNGKSLGDDSMHVKRTKIFPIDARVRALHGTAFFDWVAERIEEMLDTDGHEADHGSGPLPMGLAWSFPIEQTSARSGFLLQMGKGFCATNGVQGRDLCELIMTPCVRRGLNVQLQSIVNDASATLLAQAYREPSTRISLILGTGTNSAVFLPVSALAREKFGTRPEEWFETADHVIVNTELSMYGKDALPSSPWDDRLNEMHQLPDFQPFEHRVGGRYLGEIVRLILVEAMHVAGLFDGELPTGLEESYALDTGVLAAIERYEHIINTQSHFSCIANMLYLATTAPPSLKPAQHSTPLTHPADPPPCPKCTSSAPFPTSSPTAPPPTKPPPCTPCYLYAPDAKVKTHSPRTST